MKRLVLSLIAVAGLAGPFAAPVAAQSLTTLLPTLDFPETVVIPSTKGCAPDLAVETCPVQR